MRIIEAIRNLRESYEEDIISGVADSYNVTVRRAKTGDEYYFVGEKINLDDFINQANAELSELGKQLVLSYTKDIGKGLLMQAAVLGRYTGEEPVGEV